MHEVCVMHSVHVLILCYFELLVHFLDSVTGFQNTQIMLYFPITFSVVFLQSTLPYCMREVWVITACLALINSTSSHYDGGLVAPDVEKEFYRLQGDLYSLSRVKVNFTMLLKTVSKCNY